MSSTNRGGVRSSDDYYVTPIESIETLFRKIRGGLLYQLQHGEILDPCAGGNDEIRDKDGIRNVAHKMSYPTAIKHLFRNEKIITYDIRNDSLATTKCDYLKTECANRFSVIITNPPFAIALDIIKKALEDVRNGGYVVMLLRLNFLESQKRKPFFDKYMPNEIYVHSKRISFMDKKDKDGYVIFDHNGNPVKAGSDSVAYSHMVWCKGVRPECSSLYII